MLKIYIEILNMQMWCLFIACKTCMYMMNTVAAIEQFRELLSQRLIFDIKVLNSKIPELGQNT